MAAPSLPPPPLPPSTAAGNPSHPGRVCFSFAAYARTLIDHLRSSHIPVAPGLTDAEFSAVESVLGFKFPPDLRAILAEGLPVGPGFPNWRSNSLHHLRALLRLPASGILGEIANRRFWPRAASWGARPEGRDEVMAVAVAVGLLARAPVLVPVYRHCYIVAEPELAGNPLFYVRRGEVRYAGYDLAGFFAGGAAVGGWWAPAWAAPVPRRVEFWAELAEEEEAGGWWEITCGKEGSTCVMKGVTCGGEGGGWMEELRERLREGGWREEEVAEMLEGGGGGGGGAGVGAATERRQARDWAGVAWHVRLLSLTLRRAGWSREDVGYALGGFHDPSWAGPLEVTH